MQINNKELLIFYKKFQKLRKLEVKWRKMTLKLQNKKMKNNMEH